MPGKWKTFYFEQIGAAIEAGPAGQTAINKLSPMTFVASELTETVGWSVIAGVGTVALHGALTQFSNSQTLYWGIGAIGVMLLSPLVKDGVVSIIADVIELRERRQDNADATPQDYQDEDKENLAHSLGVPFVKEANGLTEGTGTWTTIPSIPRIKNGNVTGYVPRRETWNLIRHMELNNLDRFPGEGRVNGVSQGNYRAITAYFCRSNRANKMPDNSIILTPRGLRVSAAWALVEKPYK